MSIIIRSPPSFKRNVSPFGALFRFAVLVKTELSDDAFSRVMVG